LGRVFGSVINAVMEENIRNLIKINEKETMKYSKKRQYEKFNEIKEYYNKIDNLRLKKGNSIRPTKYGIFGSSDCGVVFDVFNMLELQKYKNFVDLGSGDGRVVLIASLFTKVAGFETDKKLNNFAKKARKNLQLTADFRTEDYFQEDLSKYDALFIYPSRNYNQKFKKKALDELKGLLIVYKIYFPRYLKKVISFIGDNLRINCYRHPEEDID